MHATQHFLVQDSGLPTLDSTLIGAASLALALSASLEDPSVDTRLQVEKYGVDRHRKRDRRFDAALFGVSENSSRRNDRQTVIQIDVKAGRDQGNRMFSARDKAARNEGVKRINLFQLLRSQAHGWCPLGVGLQAGF